MRVTAAASVRERRVPLLGAPLLAGVALGIFVVAAVSARLGCEHCLGIRFWTVSVGGAVARCDGVAISPNCLPAGMNGRRGAASGATRTREGVEHSAACPATDRDAFQHEKRGSLSTFPTRSPGWRRCIQTTGSRWETLIFRLVHRMEHYGARECSSEKRGEERATRCRDHPFGTVRLAAWICWPGRAR